MSKPTLDGKLMFPTQYLASEEFTGKDVPLTIKDVRVENLRMSDGGTEDKVILTFTKTDKKLVLNKTNATTIAKLYGGEARAWVGKTITLFPTECSAFGKTVDCIRVRSTKPKHKPASDPGSAPATEQRLPVTEQESPQPQAASGSVPKANRDIAESIATQDAEPVLADVGRVADLLSVDMDDERWSTLISQGSIRAAINTMLDEVE